MEYMALGKPVVSFDLKETRVSAGDAAVYVEPNDEAEFAKAILQLMDDPGTTTDGWANPERTGSRGIELECHIEEPPCGV